jgi:hypothetical protein
MSSPSGPQGRTAQYVTAQYVDKPVDMSMRARQLVASVRQGRRLTVQVLDEDPFVGYLAGWDDDTYFLLMPNGRTVLKVLIPKSHILYIQLAEERSFREEAQYEDMESIVRSFRDALNKQYPKN